MQVKTDDSYNPNQFDKEFDIPSPQFRTRSKSNKNFREKQERQIPIDIKMFLFCCEIERISNEKRELQVFQDDFQKIANQARELEDENQELVGELERYQQEAEQYEQTFKFKITELNKSVEEWKNRYQKLSQDHELEVNTLREENEHLRQEMTLVRLQSNPKQTLIDSKNSEDWESLKRFEDEYNELKATVDLNKLHQKVQQLEDENSKLKKQHENSQEKITRLNDQLRSMNTDINQLHQDNEYSLELIKEKEREIQSMQQQQDKGREYLKQQPDNQNKLMIMKQEIERLNTLLKQTHYQLQDAQQQQAILEGELFEAANNGEWLTKINLLGSEIERLNNVLSLKTRENNDYRNQMVRMQKEIQSLRMNEFKLQDLNINLDELIDQHSQLQRENTDLKQMSNNKQAKLQTENEKRIQTQQMELDKCYQQINSMKKEVEYLRQQLNNYTNVEEGNKAMKRQNDKLQQQVKQLEQNSVEVQQQYQLLLNELNSNKFQHERLLMEQQDYQHQINNLQHELKQQSKQNKDKQNELQQFDELESRLESQNQKIEKQQKQILSLQQALHNKQGELTELQSNNFIRNQRVEDQGIVQKLNQYEQRFPLLVDEIERLNKILKSKEEMSPYNRQSDSEMYYEQTMELQTEVERLKQVAILKQQQIDKLNNQLNNQGQNPGVQDIVYKLQDENKRLTSLVSMRNQELAEFKSKVTELERRTKQLLSESNPSKYESRIQLLNDEIRDLNQQLQQCRNEIEVFRISKNDKFSEERGRILSSELDRQCKINKENEKELMDLRAQFANSVDVERKLQDCQCLLVLLFNELERLQFNNTQF